MLTSKMFATTLLSQQIHDTVCSIGRGSAISNRWRVVILCSGGGGDDGASSKGGIHELQIAFPFTLFSLLTTLLLPVPLVRVLFFLIVAKSGAHYSTFLRTLNMKSSNGSENAEIPVYNAYCRCFGV